MKRLTLVVILAALLAGPVTARNPAPAGAQAVPVYTYPAPPANIYAVPWVGPNTPWVFYNGDWFLNGLLYYFFGPAYGWAPYYAYAPVYIVRPDYWYGPRWVEWYYQHPVYVQNFVRTYPQWHGHQIGHRYDEHFYNRYHRGQGGGWQRGSHGDNHRDGPQKGFQGDNHRDGPSKGRPQGRPEGQRGQRDGSARRTPARVG